MNLKNKENETFEVGVYFAIPRNLQDEYYVVVARAAFSKRHSVAALTI